MDLNDETQVDDTTEADEQELESELPEDTTDWKAEATRFKGMATRYRNKFLKASEAKKPTPTNTETPAKEAQAKSELVLIEKAFLRSEGIKTAEEVALALDHKKNTGKELDEVVDSKFFQAELKELRETKASQEATPSASNRGAPQAKDKVEYWLAKGELPPATQENVELRRKVVAAKTARAKGSGKFYNS